MKRLFTAFALLACSKGGRLYEVLKPVRERLSAGDTLAAARAYLEALNDRLVASAYVSEDVGWEEFEEVGKGIVRGLVRGAGGESLPQAWVRLNLSLRILERLYDLKPERAGDLAREVEAGLEGVVARTLDEANSLWSQGDTSGTLELLAQAQEALSTPLPRFRKRIKALALRRAELGAQAGRLTPGMSVAQAESLLGEPLSVDTAFAALSGRLGVVFKWETVAAFVVDDTVEDVLPNP